MNRRTRRQSPTQDSPSYLRFLKPGALAKLRDSRISAKAQRMDAKPTQISSLVRPSSSPTPAAAAPVTAQTQIGSVDGPPSSPLFAGRIYGPRCPQRKKLVAAKAFYYTGPITSSPSRESDPIPVSGFLNSADNSNPNILVAH